MVKQIELKLQTIHCDETDDKFEAKRQMRLIAEKIADISSELYSRLLKTFEETGEIPKSLEINLKFRIRETVPTIKAEYKAIRGIVKLGIAKKGQVAIANEIGISQSTISKFANERSIPRKQTFQKIRRWVFENRYKIHKNYKEDQSSSTVFVLSPEERQALWDVMHLDF